MGRLILDFRFSILDSPPPIQNPKSAQPKREADQPQAEIENGGGALVQPGEIPLEKGDDDET
jgi:hypothetical protein